LQALRTAIEGGSEPPNCRSQIADCRLGESAAGVETGVPAVLGRLVFRRVGSIFGAWI
jgi:hypothetical protein